MPDFGIGLPQTSSSPKTAFSAKNSSRNYVSSTSRSFDIVKSAVRVSPWQNSIYPKVDAAVEIGPYVVQKADYYSLQLHQWLCDTIIDSFLLSIGIST